MSMPNLNFRIFKNNVLSHSVLASCLCQGEIGHGKEILVKSHVVVDVLVACNASHCIFFSVYADCQSIGDAVATVKASVIVAYHSKFGRFVGVSPLARD